MKTRLVSFFSTVLLLLEVFCIRGIFTLADSFPLENTEAVIFTTTQNISGASPFIFTLFLTIFKDTLVITLLAAFVITALLIILKTKKKITYVRLISLLNIICFVLLVTFILAKIPFVKYYQEWKNSSTLPEITNIYDTEYIHPDSVKIEFPQKRNLILIFLESVEYNFQDSLNGGTLPQNLIPEITSYIKANQSFIPGGIQIHGTGWTMADAVAKTCGVPLTLSPHFQAPPTPRGMFFPGITCLTDILHNNGYISIVSQGSQLSFAKMDAFAKTHSIDHGYGFDEYKQIRYLDDNILSEWGITDSAHYSLIKEHIGNISTTGTPWAIWFFTINTHTPYGVKDPSCHVPDNISHRDALYARIRCSSQQLDNFIQWSKTQEWFSNTTIAVMGDHATMASPHITGFNGNKQSHYWLDLFINSSKKPLINERAFSSLDMFPTILESMGAIIPGRALGLGRSLYSLGPTLLEKYGLDSLNKALEQQSPKYKQLLYSDRKDKKIPEPLSPGK